MTNNGIVVVGSSNIDLRIKTKKMPSPGETVLGGSFDKFSGGKGANQAIAIARWGRKVTFISKIGNDSFGKEVIELYKKDNINTEYIFIDKVSPTGVALIMVDEKGENIISVASGANATLSIENINSIIREIEVASIILMQLEIPLQTVEHIAKIAADKNIKVVLNPAPMTNLSDDLLSSLYAIIPNKIEAEWLSGIKIVDWNTAKRAADLISRKGVEVVVITLGAKGAIIKEKNCYHEIPGIKVQAVDTTAAGDTFCGVFTVGLSEGMSVKDSVEMATKAASICVTREGAQSSIPFRKELTKIIINK
jgi:ribokinase